MLFGIDAGNTDIAAALIDRGRIVQEYRYKTQKHKTAEYHRRHLGAQTAAFPISGVIISSVVPEINGYLEQACLELTGMSPLFVSSNMETGLKIKYDNPAKLGADLIADAVGGVSKYGAPAVIIDIGTATTFSVINGDKEYLGGMIAPGPGTSMKALAAMTSQLPEAELTFTDKVIGSNTAECMQIGTLTAHAAMIDGMLQKVLSSLNLPEAAIIATGGMASEIIGMCSHKIICDKTLLFCGLYELFLKNSAE